MTREQAKELIPAIKWWAEGNALWFYDVLAKKWLPYTKSEIAFNMNEASAYVIEDEHFEARKAYALGKPIEVREELSSKWLICNNTPTWNGRYKYRPALPKWYESNYNIGKIVMVRDCDNEEWYAGKFEKFAMGEKYPFTVDGGNWQQARLLTDDDLAKENNDDT